MVRRGRDFDAAPRILYVFEELKLKETPGEEIWGANGVKCQCVTVVKGCERKKKEAFKWFDEELSCVIKHLCQCDAQKGPCLPVLRHNEVELWE